MPLVELIVVEKEFSAFARPVRWVEEDVHSALAALREARRLRHRVVLHHPLPELLVPAPVAAVELCGGGFLQDVAGLGVEYLEEGVVAEIWHAAGGIGHVVHSVCGWDCEVWDSASRAWLDGKDLRRWETRARGWSKSATDNHFLRHIDDLPAEVDAEAV